MKCTNWSQCECDGAFTSSFAMRQQSHHIKTVKHSYLTKGAKVEEQPKSIAAHPQSQGTMPEHPRSKTDKLAGHPHKAVVRCQDTHYRHRDSSRTFTFSSGAAVDSYEYKAIEKKTPQNPNQYAEFSLCVMMMNCSSKTPKADPWPWTMVMLPLETGICLRFCRSSLWFCGLVSQQAT